jgi:hypothetical protein
VLGPALKRSVLALRHGVPRLCGGWRTRWSCATIALELPARRGWSVSAETVRRWRQALDGEWTRAKRRATEDAPQRVEKRARSRRAVEQLRAGGALFFADEVALRRLPQVGYPGRPQGTQVAILTPGTNEKRDLAGALDIPTGPIHPWVG